MFKTIKWREAIRALFLALAALLAGAGGSELKDLFTEPGPELYGAVAPDMEIAGAGQGDGAYSALYRVEIYWGQDVVTGGNGLPEQVVPIPGFYSTHVVKIVEAYSSEKVRQQVEPLKPYPGLVFDKVWSKTFVRWIKRPSSGGDKPGPGTPTQ